MAVITNLKTRISLRNDNISAWESSQDPVVLRKGEVALGRLSGDLSDYYEMRIGVGDKKWKELSGSNVMFKAENISDLSDYIQKNAPKAQFFEASSYAELSTENVPHGSIAVVKETVVKGKGESATSVDFRTAYWFDASLTSQTNTNGTWRQMDGNYKAENVYFTDDLRLTEQFGRYKAVNTGYTLFCKNMSLDAVLKDAYAETKQPTITEPSVSFTLEKTSNSGEVGATYTLPKNMTFKTTSVGSYTYGPPTGVTMSAMISAEPSTGMTKAAKDGLKLNGTITAAANVTSAYTDAAAIYNYRAEYTWTEGAIPKNNIGGQATVAGIQANNNGVATQTYTATGWRKCFLGFRSLDDGALDFSNFTAVNTGTFKNMINKSGKAKEWKTTDGWPTSFVIPKGTNQTIVAVPSTYRSDIKTITALDPSKNRLQFFDTKEESLRNMREIGTIQLKGATDGSAAVAYDLWVRSEGAGQFGADTEYTVTFA